MSSATTLQDRQWRAIEAVNALVECDASWEDRHRAIELVGAHIASRAEQCRVLEAGGAQAFPPDKFLRITLSSCTSAPDNSDLL